MHRQGFNEIFIPTVKMLAGSKRFENITEKVGLEFTDIYEHTQYGYRIRALKYPLQERSDVFPGSYQQREPSFKGSQSAVELTGKVCIR